MLCVKAITVNLIVRTEEPVVGGWSEKQCRWVLGYDWWFGLSLRAALWAPNSLGFVPSPESAEASLNSIVLVYSCMRRWHVCSEMSATVSGSPGRISRSFTQSIPDVTLYGDGGTMRALRTGQRPRMDVRSAAAPYFCVSVLMAG